MESCDACGAAAPDEAYEREDAKVEDEPVLKQEIKEPEFNLSLAEEEARIFKNLLIDYRVHTPLLVVSAFDSSNPALVIRKLSYSQ